MKSGLRLRGGITFGKDSVMSKEIKQFNDQFKEEATEITVVTDSSGFGGSRSQGEKLWTASIGVTAWKPVGSEEINKGKYALVAKADDKYLDKLREQVKQDSIISLKVKQKENSFLFIEVIETKSAEKELEEILAEQIKPIIYKDEVLGEFTFDRQIDQFTKIIKWLGGEVNLNVDNCEEEELADLFAAANEIIKEKEAWDKKIKEFAASELLDLKNDNWLEEDETEITATQFVEKIKIDSISISPENEFGFYLNDGDIFWGHTIIVSGNLDEGLLDAEIAG